MFKSISKELQNSETVLEVSFEEKEKIIMMAAYFNDNKAPDLLLKAWRKIKDQHPDWRVCMLGNGEVERFRQMAAEMGLQDTVTFTGYVVGKERDVYSHFSTDYYNRTIDSIY